MSTKPVVLVVEDEEAISNLVAFHLEQTGFTPFVTASGRQALEFTRSRVPALVILDLMLPDVDGLDVLSTLRRDDRTLHIPIILLTARAEEIDRIRGFELGADDYLAKPFSPRELMLRVQRLIHSRVPRVASSETLISGPVTIDERRFSVLVDGEPVEVSATEMRLLTTLVKHEGTVFSRGQLLQDSWGYMPNVTERTVDTHVKRLRQKLGSSAECLETVRGVGYRWSSAGSGETPEDGDVS